MYYIYEAGTNLIAFLVTQPAGALIGQAVAAKEMKQGTLIGSVGHFFLPACINVVRTLTVEQIEEIDT